MSDSCYCRDQHFGVVVLQLSGPVLQPVNGGLILVDFGVALLRRVELALLNHAEDFGVATLVYIQILTHGTKTGFVVSRKLEFFKFGKDFAKLLPRAIPLGVVLSADRRFLDVEEGILFETATAQRGSLGAAG